MSLRNTKIILILITLLIANLSFGQGNTILVSGRISGFGMENVKILKKLKKNILLEGPLSNVSVSVTNGQSKKTIHTDIDGTFEFEAKKGTVYSVKATKSGYSTMAYQVDLKNCNVDNSFKELRNLMIMLGKEDEGNYFVGTFAVNNKGNTKFVSAISDENQITAINEEFGFKTANINNALFKPSKKESANKEEIIQDSVAPDHSTTIMGQDIKMAEIVSEIDAILAADLWQDEDVDRWKSLLDSSKVLLSTYKEGSLEYDVLLHKIRAMEDKLNYAQKIIDLQDEQLKSQRRIIWLISFLLILVVAIALLLLYFFRQKKIYVFEIERRNIEISRQNNRINSSLEYASLIQHALLNKAGDIGEYFASSFVFYKPKVLVSGDFYWFSKRGDEFILVVADCTGHGVPGALLTMLGHSALEHIVNYQGITSPKEIMQQLDTEITLQLQDGNINKLNGMDIAIVTINQKTNVARYCGAMREIYIVKDNQLQMIKPNLFSIASGRSKDIREEELILSKKDSIFMFTDGYQDQFRGNSDEVETYNFKRFEELLARVGKESSFDNTNKLLLKELDQWKQGHDQIDDILILGVRL